MVVWLVKGEEEKRRQPRKGYIPWSEDMRKKKWAGFCAITKVDFSTPIYLIDLV